MKKLGYLLFAFWYYVFRIFPMKKNSVFCIMTHDSSSNSNIGILINNLKKKKKYKFYYIKKEQRNEVRNLKILKNLISFFIIKPYQLARAEFILEDNIFLPTAYIKFRKKTKVIQLWHGTGTIKKFGQDVNIGKLKNLEKRANSTITHLIVNSNYMKKLSKSAFGVNENKIYVTGLPKTDYFFNKKLIKNDINRFYKQFSNLQNKKLILYAPTFRDNEINNPKIMLNIGKLLSSISGEFVLGLRLHPFVSDNFKKDFKSNRLINLSNYNNLNVLLLVSYLLITDYSSIIFEYCLLDKPMLFYAYDLEEFSQNGRGFYENYSNYIPGKIVKSTEEIIDCINNKNFNIEKVKPFKEKSYKYLDGKSTKRIINKIFK